MADAKVTALTENTTPEDSDLSLVVDDVSGTPVTQKITLNNLLSKGIGKMLIVGSGKFIN